jgi:MFS transporter, DHA1 family, multidrug resistance protein
MKIFCSAFQKRNTIFFLLNSAFLVGLATDLYVPSLTVIRSEFHVINQLSQMTVSIYFLGYGIGQFFLGLISDSIGRKKIIVISSLSFVIASFLTPVSYNIYFLIFFRLFQGICLGGLIANCRALCSDCFSGLSLNKIMTYFSACWSISPIIGPFIGSNLQHFFNWQANFYFLGIYGLVVTISSLSLAETKVEFLHHSEIIQNLKYVSKHKIFLYSTIILSFIYSILIIFNIIGPFLIQDVLRYSVRDFGRITFALGFGYFLGNITNRFLLNHLKPFIISLFGIISMLFLSLIMILVDSFTKMDLFKIFFPTFFLFFFCGISFVNIMSFIMSLFPKIAGITSAVFGLFFSVISFLLTSFATFLKTSTQLPTSITYALLSLSCLILFIVVRLQKEKF